MIDRKTIYDAAQWVVKEQDYAAKIYNVKRTPEEVIIHFYAEKRIPLKELARDLEFTLNVPIKLERVTKEDFGRVGETQILAYHQCCAPLTKHCLFDAGHGCPYGIPISRTAAEIARPLRAGSREPVEPLNPRTAAEIDVALPASAREPAAEKESKKEKTKKEKKPKRKKVVRKVVIK